MNPIFLLRQRRTALALLMILLIPLSLLAASGPSAEGFRVLPRPAAEIGVRLTPLYGWQARPELEMAGAPFRLADEPSASGESTMPGVFTRLGTDAIRAGRYLVGDIVHLYTSPTRMTWTDAAWLTGAVAVGVSMYSADQEIYDAMQEIRDDAWYRPIRHTGEFFEPLGTRAFAESWYIGGLVVGYITGWPPLRDTSADMLEAIYLSLPFMTATKFGAGRLRPYQSHRADWGHSDGASFISGHTSNIFLLAGVISHHGNHPAWTVAGYTMATSVALERMTSTDHWPSDVYVGALWGWFVTKQMFGLKENRSVQVQPMITQDGQGVGLTLALAL